MFLILLFSAIYLRDIASINDVSDSSDQRNVGTSNDKHHRRKLTEPKEAPEMPKLYAFYFPQFHSDPLNNKLWGDGYTDWNRLKAAGETNRLGHEILRPIDKIADYDLMEQSTRSWQGNTAKRYGIDGFIYHSYWFYQDEEGENGIPPLGSPLQQMLLDNQPNISFCLHWANDNWTSTWIGSRSTNMKEYVVGELLHQQKYPRDPNDALIAKHYKYLRQFFHHPNYIKVDNGVPLFMVYKGGDAFRQEFSNLDLESLRIVLGKLKLLAMQDGFEYPGLHIPQSQIIGITDYPAPLSRSIYDSIVYYPAAIRQFAEQFNLEEFCTYEYQQVPNYFGLYTLFDNTPRRNRSEAFILHRKYSNLSAPDSFMWELIDIMMLERCCQYGYAREHGAKMVTINAWNEWGEGMALEPSKQFGYTFLEAVLRAKELVASVGCDLEELKRIRSKSTTTTATTSSTDGYSIDN